MIIDADQMVKIHRPVCSESDFSEENNCDSGAGQMTYYVFEAQSLTDNLAGEEIVILKSDENTYDSVVATDREDRTESQNEMVYRINQQVKLPKQGFAGSASRADEVRQAVLNLERQNSAASSSPETRASFTSSSSHSSSSNIISYENSRKRKAVTQTEAAVKRKRTGEGDRLNQVNAAGKNENDMTSFLRNGSVVQSRSSNSSSNSSYSPSCSGSNGKALYKCPTCDKIFETDKYLSMHLSLHKYQDTVRLSLDSNSEATGLVQQKFNAELKPPKTSRIAVPLANGSLAAAASAALATPTTGSNTLTITTTTSGHWTCPYCQKTFVQNSNFKNHVRTHSDERPFVCDICSIGFKERYHLKKHVLFKHTNDLKETCRICGKCFKDSTAVRAHERIHSEVRPYGCNLCGKTFKTSECLWHHENRSKTCGKAMLAKQLQEQKQNHNQLNFENGFQPSQLLKNLSVVTLPQPKRQRKIKLTSSSLGLPKAAQQKPKKTTGQLQGNISKNQLAFCDLKDNMVNADSLDNSVLDEMWANLNGFESSQDSDGSGSKSPKNFDSITFDSSKKEVSFSNSSSSSINSEIRPYKCKLCDNAFKLKVHLKKHHLYRHTNEYPCECSICGKRFKDTSAVRLHERIHSSERPFKCTCGKSFKTRENLWGHKNRGPCDPRQAAGSIVDEKTGAYFAGKMRLYKSSEFGTIIGLPLEDATSGVEQGFEKVMKLQLIDKSPSGGMPFSTNKCTVRSNLNLNGSVQSHTFNHIPMLSTSTATTTVMMNGAPGTVFTQMANSNLKTTTIKVLPSIEPSLQAITSFSEPSEYPTSSSCSLSIPTAIVAPIQRSRPLPAVKAPTSSAAKTAQRSAGLAVHLSTSQEQLLQSRANAFQHVTTTARKCPTIQNLLLSNRANQLLLNTATTTLNNSSNDNQNSIHNSIAESRIMKLLPTSNHNNNNNSLTTILLPSVSQQQSALSADFNQNLRNETSNFPIHSSSNSKYSTAAPGRVLVRSSQSDSSPSDISRASDDLYEYLAEKDSDDEDIFDFKLEDPTDGVGCFHNNVASAGAFEDISDEHPPNLDDLYSTWPCDETTIAVTPDNWLLGEESFLVDLKLPDNGTLVFNHCSPDFLM